MPSQTPSIRLDGPLVRARFVERPNRFVVRARLDEKLARIREVRSAAAPPSPAGPVASALVPSGEGDPVVACHLPDPGRLHELLVPGRRLWLRPATGSHRKTAWTAVLVETPDGSGSVSLDTTLPNRLVEAALRQDALKELAGWALERREFCHGSSRLDFLLTNTSGGRLALEVKSVTLVEDGVAKFPDAVTARGARHVEELTELTGTDGWAAAILFVLQRDDADRIRAAPSIDPGFATALARAKEAGVRVLGRRCRVDERQVVLDESVPAG